MSRRSSKPEPVTDDESATIVEALAPTVEEVEARLEAEDLAAVKAQRRHRAEKIVAEAARLAAAVELAKRDPRDIQAIMDALPDGARWVAGRGDYWAKGAIDLRGKVGLFLDFGGAVVEISDPKGTAVFLHDDAAKNRVFNATFRYVGLPIAPALGEVE